MFILKRVAACFFAVVVSLGTAFAQMPEGRVYSLHSEAVGGCPSLDWHIVIESNDTLSGVIAWDDMKVLARAVGKLNRETRTFTMVVKEIGRPARTAKIEGVVKENGWITATIKGPKVTREAIVASFQRLIPNDYPNVPVSAYTNAWHLHTA